MQEYALYGQVPGEVYGQVLQQLAGVARMQPQRLEELHLIFKGRPPPGLEDMQRSSGGGSQGVVAPEVQKIRTMLGASLYYVQLVGTVQPKPHNGGKNGLNVNASETSDVEMINRNARGITEDARPATWTLEFRDTPDPGKQPVTSRLLFKVSIVEGEIVTFIEDFGFDFVSRYAINGHKFYDQDTTLFLHRVMQVPVVDAKSGGDLAVMPKATDMVPLDKSDAYILSATIESADGSNSELREKATRQLLAMKETMKAAVNLTAADRLALDTKVPIAVGQRR